MLIVVGGRAQLTPPSERDVEEFLAHIPPVPFRVFGVSYDPRRWRGVLLELRFCYECRKCHEFVVQEMN